MSRKRNEKKKKEKRLLILKRMRVCRDSTRENRGKKEEFLFSFRTAASKREKRVEAKRSEGLVREYVP